MMSAEALENLKVRWVDTQDANIANNERNLHRDQMLVLIDIAQRLEVMHRNQIYNSGGPTKIMPAAKTGP